ncbi:MAG: chlorite dismutase family protein [Deltaproteobacteria bacterium]|nr:chlorite dismutase family protein [Deltaproteobacteria bacterium]
MPVNMEGLTDIAEKGGVKDGVRQSLDRRLFMQLLAFGNCSDTGAIIEVLKKSGIPSVLYADVNDPEGVGLLTMSEDPGFFVNELRSLLNGKEFSSLELKSEYTMLGRTYSLGHEENLEDWLINRSPRVVGNSAWQWAVWYPLKRSGAFARLSPKEQGEILMEHGVIGRAFGKADLGHDIRLSSFGLDKNDNDFVIGLIGRELFPLSALVQTMRKTVQTSTYIDRMGPFFIGKAIYQAPAK